MRVSPRGLFLALVGAQLAYPRAPEGADTAATHGIIGLLLATSVADAVQERGPARAAGTLGSAAALGYGAELVGVATGKPFGHYHYGPKLGPAWRGVPWAVGASWAMMSRPAWTVAGLLSRRRAPRAVLAAAALTAWDVYVDPRMVRGGWWSWPQGGRYEGVPASNFLGWFVTALGVFGVWAAVDPEDDPRGGSGDVALAVYTWTWVGEAVANVLFWKRPVVAAAGGAAMGALAVPALRARLAAR